jgi:hypothetical protein
MKPTQGDADSVSADILRRRSTAANGAGAEGVGDG